MSAQKDLNLGDFEKILKAEKKRVEKNIEAIKTEVETIAFEDEIDDVVDMAELQIDNMTDQTLLHKLEAESVEIDAALERIKSGSYGICQKSGKQIPLERLKANPYARTINI
ncbi:MAG: conjugal transfer protein TraR [Sulfurimonas sp. RIFCSPHIGHO2_12_FULL_36_9]|uniref:TraR/DksA family transcriptional regulator n=1 Tax=Sulfurimonas sp. RIFCSPLOWO2_12_36_12 TaxID=1802253 RepID=UPI0008B65654|nr:TraR/DksA C4-type zinc finger protein [Sulfurimonas sp. RIFCSPLOWO2_12_36_12]OHD97182.1 MAG: conjugal transfer protein TraR [Sulfurimonas sp. RIFCSPHIGHO2_12_FULL_36_9]OHD98926.1 MAG: conjugal transfer protein TraR [Sulfurimonas sp. RIFCSPLOWO2_02_FULL_36_28]OHE02355.1 MAG: conjugal transfer protein TraR [Sulfurimonas sp. RIFCSPLOWO2_12_36_12]OHE04558.1 MAG: conjugal transfer protein TraR [Sulfurimonas sp. RIFCSPLOWO2_12_FULL_36_74]